MESLGFLQRNRTEEDLGSRLALPPPQPVSWQCLYGCYVHSSIVPTFHRRCYWLLQVRAGELQSRFFLALGGRTKQKDERVLSGKEGEGG